MSHSNANFDLTYANIKDYILLDKLGEGAFASVYRAEKKGLEGVYSAVKCFKLRNDTDAQQLHREVDAMKKFHGKSANIVEIQDQDFKPSLNDREIGYGFIMMEYIDGGSLERAIHHLGGLLDYPVIFDLMMQIGSAVTQMHGQHFLHFDLKPANILIKLVQPKGLQFKVADLGIAQFVRPGGQLSNLGGTRPYMAPEMFIQIEKVRQNEDFKNIHAEQPDQRADIYSLGAIFYELITGQLPYHADSLADFFNKQLSRLPAEPISPYEGEKIPSELSNIIMRALAPNPRDRFPSVEEFINAVQTFFEHNDMLSSRRMSKTDLENQVCQEAASRPKPPNPRLFEITVVDPDRHKKLSPPYDHEIIVGSSPSADLRLDHPKANLPPHALKLIPDTGMIHVINLAMEQTLSINGESLLIGSDTEWKANQWTDVADYSLRLEKAPEAGPLPTELTERLHKNLTRPLFSIQVNPGIIAVQDKTLFSVLVFPEDIPETVYEVKIQPGQLQEKWFDIAPPKSIRPGQADNRIDVHIYIPPSELPPPGRYKIGITVEAKGLSEVGVIAYIRVLENELFDITLDIAPKRFLPSRWHTRLLTIRNQSNSNDQFTIEIGRHAGLKLHPSNAKPFSVQVAPGSVGIIPIRVARVERKSGFAHFTVHVRGKTLSKREDTAFEFDRQKRSIFLAFLAVALVTVIATVIDRIFLAGRISEAAGALFEPLRHLIEQLYANLLRRA